VRVVRAPIELEDMCLVKRKPRTSLQKGKLSNEYDLSGLVARLKELAIEFKVADEEAAKKKLAVGRPGFRKRMTSADEPD
jgi:hypothetical protein